MMSLNSAVILGSGNVATQLGKAFTAAGIKVLQVFSRRLEHAQRLAGELRCDASDNMDDLRADASFYVIAVTDDAIEELAAAFPHPKKLLLHTSGSIDMHALKAGSSNYGVFYPLQTFSREVALDFSSVPLCLEASDEALKAPLDRLAGRLSNQVAWISSEQRRRLHLAAVFACNFVNHMYACADNMMEGNELDFDLLRPLIMETARKVMLARPGEVQTGPAKRGNKKVLEAHATMLKDKPGLQKMYNFISESIIEMHK